MGSPMATPVWSKPSYRIIEKGEVTFDSNAKRDIHNGKHVIDVAELHRLFCLDVETGMLVTRVSRGVGKYRQTPGDRAGWLNPSGYRYVWVHGKPIKEHRLVFALANGFWPDQSVDHVNGIRDDNRPGNLRLATRSEQQRNKSANNAKLLPKGVHSEGGRFKAVIWVDGMNITLGRFDNLETASLVYDCAASCYFGGFAKMNHIGIEIDPRILA